jgi:DNA-binding CsgD family transcriptional regulator
MRVAKPIVLTDDERKSLLQWARGRKTPARLVQRAKIVLAATEGKENKDIASELNCTRKRPKNPFLSGSVVWSPVPSGFQISPDEVFNERVGAVVA